MAVSITHTQTRSVPSAGVYRTYDSVTVATGIQRQLFVFNVSDDNFSRVASVSDMLTYPNTKAAAVAASQPFYRGDIVTRDLTDIDDAQDFASNLKASLKLLLVEYDAAVNVFIGTETAVITS
jgi:hypothetical protein